MISKIETHFDLMELIIINSGMDIEMLKYSGIKDLENSLNALLECDFIIKQRMSTRVVYGVTHYGYSIYDYYNAKYRGVVETIKPEDNNKMTFIKQMSNMYSEQAMFSESDFIRYVDNLKDIKSIDLVFETLSNNSFIYSFTNHNINKIVAPTYYYDYKQDNAEFFFSMFDKSENLLDTHITYKVIDFDFENNYVKIVTAPYNPLYFEVINVNNINLFVPVNEFKKINKVNNLLDLYLED